MPCGMNGDAKTIETREVRTAKLESIMADGNVIERDGAFRENGKHEFRNQLTSFYQAAGVLWACSFSFEIRQD